ncbi:saccharopine dehydrogenase NADP-binding domain-containing protein [candidate division KSB1 bacterium]|nr:saccharopine dehydrogenase NADP-binding domain-containing protein [candidate division KSB1 bacterium]
MKTILLIGGYGGAGSALARMILRETDARVIIAGRNLDKANDFASRLNRDFPGERVHGVYVDAADIESASHVITKAELVLIASASAKHVDEIAEICLDAGVDYLDIHFGPNVYPALAPLARQIEAAGRLFITQAGFHPGLPAALIRYLAPRFDRLNSVSIGLLVHARIETLDSAREFVEELADYHAEICRAGQWRKSGYRDTAKFDFGPRFGVRTCYAMFLDELKPLPQMLGIRDLAMYVAGFDPVTDYLVFPLVAMFGKSRSDLVRDRLAKLFIWSSTKFFKPPETIQMIVEVKGLKNEQPLSVSMVAESDDGYLITAAPVVACLKQYLDGSLKPNSGLQMMGHIVEPNRFVNDLQSMNVRLTTEVSVA